MSESNPLLVQDRNIVNHKLRYFWKFMMIISVYYVLPSLQFVFFQAHDRNVVCYYNEKCKHDLGGIPAFNNVISNMGYIILGLVYICYIKLSRIEYFGDSLQDDTIYGVYNKKSIYYSLGLVLTLEGVYSAIYHICPSKLNFQFDTTFMFIGTALMIIVLYSKRHPLRLPHAFNVYIFLAVIVLLNILPLSGISDGREVWFWTIIYILMFYLMIVGTINVYYGTELKISKDIINNIKISKDIIVNFRPDDSRKFVFLLIANLSSITMLVLASYYKTKFTEWLLGLFLMNLIIYFLFYIINKILNGEIISGRLWVYMFIDICLFTVSLIYYEIAVTDKMLSPSNSRKLNRPCIFLDYFDYHDMWHIFSSFSIYLLMIIIYGIDDGLRKTKTENIKIF
tara:strand:- start:684 stop:1871 length:1188 start_codon:yes stop_codon:yes gene_type:complete